MVVNSHFFYYSKLKLMIRGLHMNDNELTKKTLKLFLIITILISTIIESVYIATEGKISILIFLLMWTPGIVAIRISRKYYKKQNILGINKCNIKYILAGILLPLLYLIISYGLTWFFLKDSYLGTSYLADLFRNSYGIKKDAPDIIIIGIFLVIGLFSSCLSAAGEEIGWRGFMYPAMEKIWNRKKALIISGVIWAVWHMPLIITGLYEADTVLWYGLIMFTIEIVGIAFLLAWLRTVSNSVWPAILLHASHNVLDQMIFQVITSNKNSGYFAGEQGFITTIMVIILATLGIVLWKKKEKGKQLI